MASLNGQTIASSYEQLLHTDTDGGGNGNTLVTIKDGDNGTTFGLKLATNKVEVIPSAADDANAFEVSKNDGTAVFTVNSSTVGATLIGTLTVGADDAGHDVIFYGDTASSNMTWDTSENHLIVNDSRLFIDQDDNVTCLYIDSESTTDNVAYLEVDALTTGSGLVVHSNSSDTNTRYLTYLINDHSSATGTRVLYLKQDAAQTAMFVDQGADGIGIDIDTESTTKQAIRIIDPKTTTGKVVSIEECDGLTTGKALYVHSNSSSNGSRILTHIVNDHASAVNTIPLKIQQDSLNVVVAIDDPKTTADNIMQITNADALTSGGMLYLESGSTSTGSRKLLHAVNENSSATGEGLRVYSNSGDSSNRNLVEIINDHASADNTRGLYIQNDGALYGIEMAGGCGIRFDSTVVSSDASTLDDYEEGYSDAGITAGSGTITVGTSGLQDKIQYTIIGNVVHFKARLEVASNSSPSGELTVTGLPVASNNPSGDAAQVCTVYFENATSAVGTDIIGIIGDGSQTMAIRKSGETDSGAGLASLVDDDTNIIITGIYFISNT